jgi:ketosteroid isomerase-like protein
MAPRIVGFAIVLGVCACRPDARKEAAAPNPDVKHVIDSLNSNVVAWYSAGHADSAAQVFAEDVWAMPPNSMPIVGRDSLRSYQQGVFSTGKWDFDLKADDVISADSIAVERGHYTLKVTAGPQAKYPSFEDQGNYIALWRRESDGHWRQVWEAKVSTVPMPAPPTPATPSIKKTPGGE